MITTAIYPNRIKDKKEVETKFNLNEFGDNIFFRTRDELLIAKDYERIVYGDHGPYIEFNKNQINWNSWYCKRKNIGYYNIYFPIDKTKIKLYEQIKDVKNLPNPPFGSRSFNGNRKEGYADYKIGKCYISPFEINLVIRNVEFSILKGILK